MQSARGGAAAGILLTALALVLGLAADGRGAAEVRASYGGTAGYQLPLWVNREVGFYKRHGIDLEILLIGAGSTNVQALLGGSIQMTQTSASSGIIAAARGAPVVIVESSDNKIPLQLIARPEIKEPRQLRGKKIGIARFGGSNDSAVLMALKAWKIDPREVTIIQAGGTAARMAALVGGQIDATVQSYPEIFKARQLGMNVLADIGDFGPYTNSSLMVTRSYLRQNHAVVKGMIEAQIEAIHYIKTNKEGTLKVLKRYLQISDPAAIEVTYDFFSRRIPRVPRTEAEGVANILREIGAAQKNPADFFDMSLLDEIEKEGFVERLYGR